MRGKGKADLKASLLPSDTKLFLCVCVRIRVEVFHV